METLITFKIESHWTENGLVIECPSSAARDFIARVLADEPLILIARKKMSEAKGEK